MSETDASLWPDPIAHLARPYVSDADEHVVIAEISDVDVNGYRGTRHAYSCLVPCSELDAALSAIAGIGSKVRSWGPHPVVSPGKVWNGAFWVAGAKGTESKYEALVHGWLNHNRTVMLPDTSFLMCYGLVPRILDNERIAWDDPKKPIYDVVEVTPLSRYEVSEGDSPAGVRVRLDYLEDYASLKGCAAVVVYNEERYSQGNSQVAELLGETDGRTFELPGRTLCVRRVDPRHARGADQLTQISGCALIVRPTKRPISEEEDPDLTWPCGRTVENFRPLEHTYVRDLALREWESRAEFSVYPKSGDVSYGGWWSTTRSNRVGRHHIGVEVAKLYEGTPPYVIRHFHRYAVPEAEVHRDQRLYGDRHIGERADEIVDAFFDLVSALVNLSAALRDVSDADELVGTTREFVHYHGWWRLDGFKDLGHVVPLDLSRDDFLARCMKLYQLFERLKRGPLKRILRALGLDAEDLKSLGEVGALRLLGTVFQLAMLAREHGYALIGDFAAVREMWDPNRRLDSMAPIFALNRLRILHGHTRGSDWDRKLDDALNAFGLDSRAMSSGWGLALDSIYDVLIRSLKDVFDLLRVAALSDPSGQV